MPVTISARSSSRMRAYRGPGAREAKLLGGIIGIVMIGLVITGYYLHVIAKPMPGLDKKLPSLCYAIDNNEVLMSAE